jgi:hypothetical protein
MSWVTQRVRERQEAKERVALIEAAMPGLWKELWSSVHELVDEYHKVGAEEAQEELSLTQFHPVFFRVEIRDSTASGRLPRELKFSLDPKALQVRVEHAAAQELFEIDADGQRTPCFKQAGREISPAQISRIFLDPLLFPELPSRVERGAT